MVRYQYVAEVSPPAPFVHVTIQNTEKPELISSELPALLDSGADRTVIPGTLVSALGLASLRKIPIGGLGMKTQELDSYSVFV